VDQPVYIDVQFPLGGVDQSQAFDTQPGRTTPEAVNVRTFEPTTDRARGGSRPGIVKYIDSRVGD
jgi:hypothetical protein